MKDALDIESPPAPWEEFPETEPFWGGWRQGNSETWLHEIWLPYWCSLTREQRTEYLRHNPPPNEDWRYYLETLWVVQQP